MLDKNRIKTRLEEMRRRVKIIEKDFKPLDEISFISNENDYSACEHHLQIAIQCCIDISNYLIARLGMERPKKESSEGFIILAKEKILPKDFAEKLSKMTGYRNIIIHEYMDADRHDTYVNIQENLGDFAEFAKYIEEFVQKHSSSS